MKSRGQQGDVLVPQPTDSPHDPLNWNSRWKASTILMAVLYTLIQPQSQVAIGPIFPVLMEEFDITIAKCSNFIGVTILVLGFSNFLWVPIAESYGRRTVFLGSLLVSMAACIWHATAQSYHSYLGSCVLDGIGSGPEETLFPMIVADVMFLKERGKYITLYMTTLFTALFLSPVACSAMAQHVGWRYFFWLQVALRGALTILAIFCLPETKWSRGKREQPGSEQSARNSTITGHAPLESADHLDSNGAGLGKAEIARIDRSNETEERQIQDYPVNLDGNSFRQGRPAKYQFRPLATPAHQDSLWLSLVRDFLVPFKIFFFPIVAFGGFSFAWAASVYGYINFDQSQLLAAPPYNFTILQVGYSNFACFVGAMVGLFTAGPFSDWVSMLATRRNKGVREPEMRLPALIPYLVLMVIGEVVSSVGADNKWSWKPIIIVGYFCAGLQVSSGPKFGLLLLIVYRLLRSQASP